MTRPLILSIVTATFSDDCMAALQELRKGGISAGHAAGFCTDVLLSINLVLVVYIAFWTLGLK